MFVMSEKVRESKVDKEKEDRKGNAGKQKVVHKKGREKKMRHMEGKKYKDEGGDGKASMQEENKR